MKNKFLITLTIIFSGIIILTNCKSDNKMIYKYSDGSGNTFTITQDSLKYSPVKPEESSSGIYDGGEYVEIKIIESDFEKIVANFEKAFENKSVHIENRVMLSGLITIDDGEKIEKIILEPNCKEQIELEELLKNILEKK